MQSVPWVVSPEEFAQRNAGAHCVIDVRNRVRFVAGHVDGAIRLSWLDFRYGRGRTGKLADVHALSRKLAARGIDGSRPVTVYGDAERGWGEDGRIVWMLRYLGFADVALADGGYRHLRHAGRSAIRRLEPLALPPAMQLRVQHGLRVSADEVQGAIDAAAGKSSGDSSGVVLVDTRSAAEWHGSRRYWPARTGRIPGAVHLEWSALLDGAGFLDRAHAVQRLAMQGITPDRTIITYCVGGVRSAHMLVMLRALGFPDVRNYDGSWYEWSADHLRPIAHPVSRRFA